MKGFHRNTERRVHEGDEVVPACQNEAKLKGHLPACVHRSLLLEHMHSHGSVMRALEDFSDCADDFIQLVCVSKCIHSDGTCLERV